MKRRIFLAVPLVEAQLAGRVFRVGWLASLPPTHAEFAALYEMFLRGMRDLGWVEGRNMVIEVRHVAGRQELFPGSAAELVQEPSMQ